MLTAKVGKLKNGDICMINIMPVSFYYNGAVVSSLCNVTTSDGQIKMIQLEDLTDIIEVEYELPVKSRKKGKK